MAKLNLMDLKNWAAVGPGQALNQADKHCLHAMKGKTVTASSHKSQHSRASGSEWCCLLKSMSVPHAKGRNAASLNRCSGQAPVRPIPQFKFGNGITVVRAG
jgi:hypothetical protein